MKPTSIRYILLVLCLSILTGSVGMASPETFCRMLGITVGPVATTAMHDGCCSAENAEAPGANDADGDCCEVEVNHQKLEPFSNLDLKVFQLALPLIGSLSSYLDYVSLDRLHTCEVLLYTDSSPPFAGRDLLRSIQLLLI